MHFTRNGQKLAPSLESEPRYWWTPAGRNSRTSRIEGCGATSITVDPTLESRADVDVPIESGKA